MKHPFEVLRGEYSQLLSLMTVRPQSRKLVDDTAVKLIGLKTRWEPISRANGVPIVLMAASFEREGSSNFNLNPAQGWPWRQHSRIIPYNGPFPSWTAAALEAYHLNGLDRVGAGNWTWELMCFYWETFNGFGPRDWHHAHTSYLWACTNLQTAGKYVEDGKWDASHWDTQIGVVPVAKRMVELDPTLALPLTIPVPISSGIAAEPETDTRWVQAALNKLNYHPELLVDGNYGRRTMGTVRMFQRDYALDVDGFVGPQTVAALKVALKALDDDKPAEPVS